MGTEYPDLGWVGLGHVTDGLWVGLGHVTDGLWMGWVALAWVRLGRGGLCIALG